MSSIQSLLINDFSKLTNTPLATLKKQWAKQLGYTPKNSAILQAYKQLLSQKRIVALPQFARQLTIRKVRSLSGVTPLAVMTKPWPCPGQCTFCPLESGMPKSYLSDEPAAQRAKLNHFDPYKQIISRLNQLQKTGHQPSKIELIVIGGTFSNYPASYKRHFIHRMFDALNPHPSPTLEQAQRLNETSPYRVVGLSVETRPDWIDDKEIVLLRQLGVTKIQLGVQAFDDDILTQVKRGHGLQAVTQATRLLKNAGFKICYHFMPNLPGSNPQKDIAMARIMYTDPRFKPDFVKIYPTQVIKGTPLYRQWQAGQYHSYSDETLFNVLLQIKKITPPWVRIDRLVRDISKKWVSSGTIYTNMRQALQDTLRKQGKSCQCIRCREAKNKQPQSALQLVTYPISTLGGQEYMLAFEDDQHTLFSLLRLRLPNAQETMLFPELENAALVRELHTFGTVIPIHAQDIHKPQHKGLGKQLMAHAEHIARQHGYKKIAVIAAIGTRPYYRQLGYKLDGLYMTKQL